MPKDFMLHKIEIYAKIPTPIPKNPKKAPKNIKTNLKVLRWKPKEKSGIAKEAIPVIATIITRIGLTMLAETAASPIIKPPTIPIVEPIGEGIRIPSFTN